MADQVNPLGGLASGMAQTLQSAAVPSTPKPAPARPAESKSRTEGRQSTAVPKESLEAAAKSVEDVLQQSPSDLKFMVDKDTGAYYFKIVNPDTHETIRQVPTEEILEMAKRLRAMSSPKDSSGVLVDKQG